MGSYKYTYVGIYLEIDNTTKEQEIINYIDPKTGKTVKTPFDPQTGEKNIKDVKIKTKTEKAYPGDFLDGEYEHYFMVPEFSNIPNKTTWILCNGNDDYKNDDECFNYEIDFDTDFCITEFKNQYDDMLDELGKTFKYVVKFGVVTYYN